jgi:hypothetical protein
LAGFDIFSIRGVGDVFFSIILEDFFGSLVQQVPIGLYVISMLMILGGDLLILEGRE